MTQRIPAQTTETSVSNDEQRLIEVLRKTLAYARKRGYRGWDYGDGMSSRLLRMLPVDNRWLNIFVQELAKRPPINLRPLLLVEQRRNYKGTALFAMANLNTAGLLGEIDGESASKIDMESIAKNGTTDDTNEPVNYTREAYQLNEWLIANRSVGYSGFCGGHNHKIQHINSKGLPNDPDIVSTSFAVKSLLSATELDPMYASIARTAEEFLVDDLDYRTVDDGAIINYHLNHSTDVYTINAGAIGARMLIDLYAYFEKESHRQRAQEIFDHIVNLQADIGGWTYREPSSSSHLSMDNHHNGFIIESLLRYRDVTGSDRYDETIDRALSFYRETLFDSSGAPNWDENKTYPRDIHASAQGILVFTYAGELDFARRILAWALDQLYAGNGQFYYRKHRLYTTRITLMRWCQAWMAYAISEYLTALSDFRSSMTSL